ncbi:hypothetical protein Pfo_017916 [Paulownia fortunei]|nr:hypothetical protein Pfo_017916 [Paulownia fortunei]
MLISGVWPNHISFLHSLQCAHFFHLRLFCSVLPFRLGTKTWLDINKEMVGTAVIDMYSEFGEMGLARLSLDHIRINNKMFWDTINSGCNQFGAAINLFDEMPERDAMSWTVLIDGFVKNGRFKEALLLFQEIQLLGKEPDV